MFDSRIQMSNYIPFLLKYPKYVILSHTQNGVANLHHTRNLYSCMRWLFDGWLYTVSLYHSNGRTGVMKLCPMKLN